MLPFNISRSSGVISKISTAQLDIVNNNSVLTTIPGLEIPLQAGKAYLCFGHLDIVALASCGIKVALVRSGGLNFTSYRATGCRWNASALGASSPRLTTTTADGLIASSASANSEIEIWASMVVNVSGTLLVQAMQSTLDAVLVTSILANSFFAAMRVD